MPFPVQAMYGRHPGLGRSIPEGTNSPEATAARCPLTAILPVLHRNRQPASEEPSCSSAELKTGDQL